MKMCSIIHVLSFGLLILSVASGDYRNNAGHQAAKIVQDQHKDCIANFCTSTKNYPYMKIRKALKENPQFDVYFGRVIVKPAASVNYREANKHQAAKIVQDYQGEDCIANLCNSTKNYLYMKIKKALKENPQFNVYFGNVFRKVRRSSDNSHLCETSNSLFYPKGGLNLDNEWKTIINVDQLRQNLVIKQCQKNSCPAAESGDSRAACIQKFSLENLLVLNTNDTISSDKFSVPTGCFCT